MLSESRVLTDGVSELGADSASLQSSVASAEEEVFFLSLFRAAFSLSCTQLSYKCCMVV